MWHEADRHHDAFARGIRRDAIGPAFAVVVAAMRMSSLALGERRKAVWGLRRLTALAALAVLVAFSSPLVMAQGRQELRPVAIQPITIAPVLASPAAGTDAAALTASAAMRTITVQGVIQDFRGLPVPNAGVVILRDMTDGKAVGETRVDAAAQFVLPGYQPGTYAAELVGIDGQVIATSGSFTAGAGQVVQIAPVVTVIAPTGMPSVLGSVTDGALNTAMGAGLTAISAGVPVSPR
jgi:hypothetical protein